jgi:hypothetical protein
VRIDGEGRRHGDKRKVAADRANLGGVDWQPSAHGVDHLRLGGDGVGKRGEQRLRRVGGLGAPGDRKIEGSTQGVPGRTAGVERDWPPLADVS